MPKRTVTTLRLLSLCSYASFHVGLHAGFVRLCLFAHFVPLNIFLCKFHAFRNSLIHLSIQGAKDIEKVQDRIEWQMKMELLNSEKQAIFWQSSLFFKLFKIYPSAFPFPYQFKEERNQIHYYGSGSFINRQAPILQCPKEECLSEEELPLQSRYDFCWILLSQRVTHILLLIATPVAIQPS